MTPILKAFYLPSTLQQRKVQYTIGASSAVDSTSTQLQNHLILARYAM